MSFVPAGVLETGFADPVLDSQAIFRLILDALAKPGTIHSVCDFVTEAPLGLQPATAACLLCLADYETPIFLPEWLRGGTAQRFLAFYTGARVTDEPLRASLAVIEGDSHECRLSHFDQGDDRYPDRSATLLVQCAHLNDGPPITLEGPGIKTTTTIAPSGLHDDFWQDVEANHALYPCGVDLIFCSGDRLMGLPRSSRIIRGVI